MDLVTFSPRFPQPGETVVGSRFLTYAGGKGANQSVGAARMGARSAIVGRVGGDIFGPQLLNGLAAAGVDISGVSVNANPGPVGNRRDRITAVDRGGDAELPPDDRKM